MTLNGSLAHPSTVSTNITSAAQHSFTQHSVAQDGIAPRDITLRSIAPHRLAQHGRLLMEVFILQDPGKRSLVKGWKTAFHS